MLTGKKNVALVVCLLGAAGGALGGFAPWTSTSLAPGLFSYDASCEISSTGEAQRTATVTHVLAIEDIDDVAVSLNGNKALTATGATYDKTFPPGFFADDDLSSAAAGEMGVGCLDWDGSADVRIGTRVKVVAQELTIEVDIWSTSRPTEHFKADANMGGGGPFEVGSVGSTASYDIDNLDRLEILVPFTVSGLATKIEVLQNKITRTQTGAMEDCDAPGCQTLVTWIIWEEDSNNNCVASNTDLDQRSLNQNGAGDTGDGTFTITLDKGHATEYVLEVRYRTRHALGASVLCGQTKTLSGTSSDHFELELKALLL